MKVAIIFDSKSGNTKMIADEIKKVFNNHEIIAYGEPSDISDADIVFVGSLCIKGEVTDKIKAFLDKIENKKIAMFMTCGAKGEDYYAMLYNNFKACINESNEILGAYICQGKLNPNNLERYKAMLEKDHDEAKYQRYLNNYNDALNHPNFDDVSKANEFASNILKSLDK